MTLAARTRESVFGLFVLLAAWELLSIAGGGRSLPSPMQVLLDFPQNAPLVLLSLGPSMLRVGAGLIIAVTLGIAIGYLLAHSRLARNWIDAPLNWLRPVPAVAFIPLFVYWFGLGDIGPIMIVSLTAIFPVILNTAAGIANIDRRLRDTVSSLGGNSLNLFWCVELPGSMPFIITGIRVAATLGWASIVAAEMFGAQAGIGYQIWVYANYLQMTVVITGVAFIGALGYLLDNGIRVVGSHLTSWSRITSG